MSDNNLPFPSELTPEELAKLAAKVGLEVRLRGQDTLFEPSDTVMRDHDRDHDRGGDRTYDREVSRN
jgi:hypothetical protein